jgi:ribosomal protein S18 acetylase RimI-like enzyme
MFQIRPCQIEDFDDVMRLLRQLWPDKPLDLVSLRTVFDRAVASESQAYLCATENQRVIGFGSLTVKNNLWHEGYLGHVDELVVDGEYRGRGIGTQLLEHLVVLARQRGCSRVELDSAFHRKQAHQFYERHGFEGRALLFSRVL